MNSTTFARRLLTLPETATPTRNTFRTRLELKPLEDRTVPTATVTAAPVSSAFEGGAAGVIQFTRTETGGPLTVGFTVGGSAAAPADFPYPGYMVGYNVTFADGQATADYAFAVTDDAAVEGTETITATVTSGVGYNPGIPAIATINVIDNGTGASPRPASPPPPAATGTLAGRVWADGNANNVYDAGEGIMG